eukprot:Amastigsp_a3457_78.p1 type:complete len:177 gc:universal Amastigsp_a3457_78:75-605(+)
MRSSRAPLLTWMQTTSGHGVDGRAAPRRAGVELTPGTTSRQTAPLAAMSEITAAILAACAALLVDRAASRGEAIERRTTLRVLRDAADRGHVASVATRLVVVTAYRRRRVRSRAAAVRQRRAACCACALGRAAALIADALCAVAVVASRVACVVVGACGRQRNKRPEQNRRDENNV